MHRASGWMLPYQLVLLVASRALGVPTQLPGWPKGLELAETKVMSLEQLPARPLCMCVSAFER